MPARKMPMTGSYVARAMSRANCIRARVTDGLSDHAAESNLELELEPLSFSSSALRSWLEVEKQRTSQLRRRNKVAKLSIISCIHNLRKPLQLETNSRFVVFFFFLKKKNVYLATSDGRTTLPVLVLWCWQPLPSSREKGMRT